MHKTYSFDSAIGMITLSCTSSGLSEVFLGGASSANQPSENGSPLLKEASRQINEYLAGGLREFDVPLDWESIRGFQREVLDMTFGIRFGEVLTYGEIARRLGKPAASRAVGAALGRNPMPIIIPCHRVVAANGALTGYSAADGIQTKAWLLTLEGRKIVGQKLA